MNTRILLVDDHQMIRQGLRALLSREPDFEVVGEAENGRTGVVLALSALPDVVVMDLQMPELNGIDATRQILAAKPEAKVICLSAHGDARMVGEMIRGGAQGYILKEAAFDELVHAIRTVLADETYVSPAIKWAAEDEKRPSVFSRLSTREREVLQLMSEGKATKEVAACLKVSVKTAETHRRNLMEKLQLDSVAELTKYAIREGITSV